MNKSPKPDLQRYFEIDAFLKGGKPRSLAEIHRKLGGDNVISSNMVKIDIQRIISNMEFPIVLKDESTIYIYELYRSYRGSIFKVIYNTKNGEIKIEGSLF